MKYYIVIHTHKFGITPFLIKSASFILKAYGINNDEREIIIDSLQIDFDENRDTIEVFIAEGYKEVVNIKF